MEMLLLRWAFGASHCSAKGLPAHIAETRLEHASQALSWIWASGSQVELGRGRLLLSSA